MTQQDSFTQTLRLYVLPAIGALCLALIIISYLVTQDVQAHNSKEAVTIEEVNNLINN